MFDFDIDKLNAYFQERYDSLLSNFYHYRDEFQDNNSDVYVGLVMVSSSLFELCRLCSASPESLSSWGMKFLDLRCCVDTLAVTVLFVKSKS